MDKNKIDQLLQRYTDGRCSPEEQALIDRWYMAEAAKKKSVDPKNPISEHDLIWEGLQLQLSLDKSAIEPKTASRMQTIRLSPLKWIAAASLLIVASLFLYRLASPDNHEALMAEIRKNDIPPGKNNATLTMPNGETINLSDGKTGVVIDATKLAYSDGTEITLSQQGENPGVSFESWNAFSKKMMSVKTPRGGTYQVVLPDGSKVWMNAASTLSFPVQFDKKSRIVMLTGEAYFEIEKNPAQPFKVLTVGQHVTVLGTHFNVNAYRDEAAPLTTLVEGSVEVSWANQVAILQPGQQAIMRNNSFAVSKANVDEVLSWKNGKFKFSNESIESLMRKISRWYNVNVEYRGKITKEKFGGQVSKFSNVSDILEVLQLTGFVHFKIEGPDQKGAERRIIVLP